MRVVALLTSDWHMSHVAPTARSCEDWYAVQKRALDQLKALQLKHGNEDLPIVVAGDFFHSWRPEHSPAELLNFLMRELPTNHVGEACIYAIPGQHDLPEHRYEAVERTPFATLVIAGKINLIEPEYPAWTHTGVTLHGFPWGHAISPLPAQTDVRLHVAVVHSFIWLDEKYVGAPTHQHVAFYRDKLAGYDAAVFGDNHQGFLAGDRLINCGTLMRRRADERDYKPLVGVLFEDGHIEPEYLDVSQDRWLEGTPSAPAGGESSGRDTSSFLDALHNLGADSLDYRESLRRKMDTANVCQEVRSIVLEAVA
jgi:hypothetical protein